MVVFAPFSLTSAAVEPQQFPILVSQPAYRLKLPEFTMVAGSLNNDRLTGSLGIDFLFGFSGSDQLRGRSGADRLFGGDDDDVLVGGKGDDELFGEAGNDLLEGGLGDDRLAGGLGDDNLLGEAGSDRFLASEGFDRFDGGEGFDTADYGAWGDAIVLRYGVTFALDQVPEVASATASSNASGNSSGSSVTGLIPQVQLEVEKGLRPQAPALPISTPPRSLPDVTVQSLPLDAESQESERFDSESSASGPSAETSRAGDGPTSEPGAELLSLPVSDTLDGIEAIVAPLGQSNSLDFSFRRVASQYDPTPAAQAPAIEVDLSQETLAFEDRRLTVKNFVKVLGSYKDDRIIGDDQDNILDGGQGRDVIVGGAGDDVLITAEKDTLTGGEGRDRFEFKAVWASYAGRSGSRPKSLRPSRVEDFSSGVDQLVVHREFDAGLVLSEERVLQYVPFYSLEGGALDPSQFLVLDAANQGVGQAVTQGAIAEQIRFVYNNQTGALYYRGPEVYGALGEQLQIATLTGAPSLQASDIVAL